MNYIWSFPQVELTTGVPARQVCTSLAPPVATVPSFRLLRARGSRRRAPPLSAASENDNGPLQAWYQEDGASREELLRLLRDKGPGEAEQGPGAVYLLGTGPGDPGLLTLKALRILQDADVVLYDRLVSEDILRLANPAALMVYVGKQRSYHTRTQQEIHELLRTFAADAGARVVRLKGGDPYIYGRGGEEMEFLEERGVKVYCVPGITAASGISAELGIPLTHRGIATSVRFLTGHAREGGELSVAENIATAVDPYTTLVIYMGLSTLRSMSNELLAKGLDPMMPAAAIERGTTLDQRVVWAPLSILADEVHAARLGSPTLIIIGNVVGLSAGWRRAAASGVCLEIPETQPFQMPKLSEEIEVPIQNSSVHMWDCSSNAF